MVGSALALCKGTPQGGVREQTNCISGIVGIEYDLSLRRGASRKSPKPGNGQIMVR